MDTNRFRLRYSDGRSGGRAGQILAGQKRAVAALAHCITTTCHLAPSLDKIVSVVLCR